jgi:hypothetical protein
VILSPPVSRFTDAGGVILTPVAEHAGDGLDQGCLAVGSDAVQDREDVLDDLPEQGMPEQAGQEVPAYPRRAERGGGTR